MYFLPTSSLLVGRPLFIVLVIVIAVVMKRSSNSTRGVASSATKRKKKTGVTNNNKSRGRSSHMPPPLSNVTIKIEKGVKGVSKKYCDDEDFLEVVGVKQGSPP